MVIFSQKKEGGYIFCYIFQQLILFFPHTTAFNKKRLQHNEMKREKKSLKEKRQQFGETMVNTALTHGPSNPKYAYCSQKLSEYLAGMFVLASADMFVLVCSRTMSHCPYVWRHGHGLQPTTRAMAESKSASLFVTGAGGEGRLLK